jgi:Raf kinase inhibitor-like YbhB/YbcL family protein
MSLRAPAIAPGGRIPAALTCDGAGRSPSLAWSGVPHGTRELAVTMVDPDAPGGAFVHWVAYGIAGGVTGLPAAVPPRPVVSRPRLRQGANSAGAAGYTGPCPPRGSVHRYVLTLLALRRPLGLAPGVDLRRLETAARGRIIARARLVARYGR